MPKPNYSKMLSRGWFTIALFGLLGLILALLISFVQPLKFSSTVRLLILQDVGVSGDIFNISRSEELIADKLSTIIYTTTFFDQVLDPAFEIDQRIFPEQDVKKRREWARTVSASVTRGTGLLTISAYHQDVQQAEQIVRAVAFVLTERVGEYTSGGNVTVRLIDAPLNSRWPVKPNLLANGLSGTALGILAGIGYILLRAERIRKRHQLAHEEMI